MNVDKENVKAVKLSGLVSFSQVAGAGVILSSALYAVLQSTVDAGVLAFICLSVFAGFSVAAYRVASTTIILGMEKAAGVVMGDTVSSVESELANVKLELEQVKKRYDLVVAHLEYFEKEE